MSLLKAIVSVALVSAVFSGRAENAFTVPGADQAYAANAGWVSLRPDVANGVFINAYFLGGKAYLANAGWLDFGDGSPGNGAAYANDSATDYGVNRDGAGNLSGYAYGANIGWVNFGWAQPDDPNRPRVDFSSGTFAGHAYSANLGWIHLAALPLRYDPASHPDLDDDGINDASELLYFTSLRTANATSDYDGDGFSDRTEVLNLTNPLDYDSPAPANPATIVAGENFAYGANAGWLNFRPSLREGVRVQEKFLSGGVFMANLGWLSLGDGSPVSAIGYANTSGTDYGVNRDAAGNLSGLGYGANIGWVNFGWAAVNDPNRPRLNPLTGVFAGYAYGANVGWIDLGTNLRHLTAFGRDDDGDGLPDAWERSYFGDLTTTDGSGDYDQDGVSEAAEYAGGTSPVDFDSPAPANPSNISASGRHAYGANVSWLDFRSSARHGVVVGERFLAGKIYGQNIGWLAVGNGTPANSLNYANNGPGDFGVNVDGAGNFSGYGYGANVGWLNFGWAGLNDPNRPRVDPVTGGMSGYVYGANIGWVNLGTGYLTANSIARADSDADGMPDAWELQHFGNLTTAGVGTDRDGDGQTDAAEYVAGTNPNSAGDFFRVMGLTFQAGHTQVTIQFSSIPGRNYRVEYTGNLTQWQDSSLGVFAPDAGSTTQRSFTVPAANAQFFRMPVGLP